MCTGTGTEEYYHHRAPAYDEVYTRPERQSDLLAVRARLTDWFAGKHVLEVAAGTGWWTSVLADTAASVNFPEPDEVRTRLNRFGQSAEVEKLDNYWLAWCRSPS